MKTVVSLLFAYLFVAWAALSLDAQEQVKDRAKLIEEAKKEGKVFVYVSSNASDARALKSAFEKNILSSTWNIIALGKTRCWHATSSKHAPAVILPTFISRAFSRS